MLTSTGVLKSFTIFQLFTGTFRGCICFQAPVTRAQSHPSAALTDHRSARAAPQPGQARLPPAERAKGAGGACGVGGQRQATARDRGEGRGPSPSPLHTGPSPGAMVGGRLGMHSVGGGGRAAGGRGWGEIRPWGWRQLPVAMGTPPGTTGLPGPQLQTMAPPQMMTKWADASTHASEVGRKRAAK